MFAGAFGAEGFNIPTPSPPTTPPEYVKFHPSDSGLGLDPVYWKREGSFPPPLPLFHSTERINQTRLIPDAFSVAIHSYFTDALLFGHVDPATFTKNTDPEGRIDVWGLWKVRLYLLCCCFLDRQTAFAYACQWVSTIAEGEVCSGWDIPGQQIFQRKV